MPATTYRGTVENGQIRLPSGVALIEHQTVYVVIPAPADERTKYVPSFRFLNPADAEKFELQVEWVNNQ